MFILYLVMAFSVTGHQPLLILGLVSCPVLNDAGTAVVEVYNKYWVDDTAWSPIGDSGSRVNTVITTV